MDISQRGIITLIKSSITGESYDLPEGFSLEDALPQMRRHHITPLCYDGAVRCGLSKDEPAMKRLFVGYCQSLVQSESQLREIARVCAAFDEHGIDYMPLKGCNMKKLYPKPELRVMGDADILIREEQLPEIEPLLIEYGFEKSSVLDHELDWDTSALHLELHRRLVPSHNEKLYSYLQDGWHLAQKGMRNAYFMLPEDEFIFMFIHFVRHYCSGGIGCRHVVDFYVFFNHHPYIDEAYIEKELEALSLLEFYKNVRRLLLVWFYSEESDGKSDFITDVIFSNGSFGTSERFALSMASKSMRENDTYVVAKLRYFIKILFPPIEIARHKFPILERHHWLLPVLWIYRPFHKLLFERHDILKQRRYLRNMTQENLDSHRRALEYVGLYNKK